VESEDLRNKIRHYEQKEKDLVERERLLDKRMKDLHEEFDAYKVGKEKELLGREEIVKSGEKKV